MAGGPRRAKRSGRARRLGLARRSGWLARVAAGACLVAPLIALLWVPLYARREPRVGGLPFFYWYQFAWIGLTILLNTIAYLLLRGREAARRQITSHVEVARHGDTGIDRASRRRREPPTHRA